MHWCVHVDMCSFPMKSWMELAVWVGGEGMWWERKISYCEYPETCVSLVISMCIERFEVSCHHIWLWYDIWIHGMEAPPIGCLHPHTSQFRGASEKQWVQGSVERDPGLEAPSAKKWRTSFPLPCYP